MSDNIITETDTDRCVQFVGMVRCSLIRPSDGRHRGMQMPKRGLQPGCPQFSSILFDFGGEFGI